MSRGPGRVERAIRALFDAHPDEAFVTDELCEHCYPGVTIEKKHRVAVLRAAWNVLKHDPNWAARSDWSQGLRDVFYNRDSVASSAMTHAMNGTYRSPKRAARAGSDLRWVPVSASNPNIRPQRFPRPPKPVRQRAAVLAWLDSEKGSQQRDRERDYVAWHRMLRDADAETRAVLIETDRAMMKLGMSGFVAWLRARVQWAFRAEEWLKRYLAATGNGRETRRPIEPTEAERLAALARRLITENDPDAIRAGLADIANALDSMAH
jgi:hypothetical protein